jgi:hypothetical protein
MIATHLRRGRPSTTSLFRFPRRLRNYEALKLRKVEAALVRFPGEPHGLSARPSHQISPRFCTW